MSQTDTIIAELQAMKAGIDRAQSTASATGNEAEKAAMKAAALGFNTIAGGMAQVREAIREVQTRLGALNGSVNEASASVTAAPKEPTPQEAIAALTQTVDRVEVAHSGTGALISKVDGIKAFVMRVLQGGDPGPLLSMLDNVNQLLVLVAQHGSTAKQALAIAVSEARQIGNSGN